MSGALNQQIGDIVCSVFWDAATPPVIQTSAGVNAQTATPAGVVRNGKGDWTINFPLQPCDILSRAAILTSADVGTTFSLGTATDTSQQVLAVDAAAAAIDGEGSLTILRTRTP